MYVFIINIITNVLYIPYDILTQKKKQQLIFC